MKKLSFILKVLILAIFVASALSACKKADETPPIIYSPEKEAEQIKEWFDLMNTDEYDIDTTANGVFYIIDTPGTGAKVKTGDEVKVKYTGYFVNGDVFDSSLLRGDGTMTYIHKNTDPKKRLIPGWEEGIELLNKGSIAIFLIPSEMAYGEDGSGPIPPYTPLIFVIEVVDIK